MNRNHYSENNPQGMKHNIVTKKNSSDLSKEDLNKLTVNDTFNEKDIRDLIYDTDSENNSNDSESDTEGPTNHKDARQPLHKCGNDQNSEIDYEKCAMEMDHEPRKISTNEKLKQIAKENDILTKKILSQQKPKKKVISDVGIKVSSSAAVNRKKAQWGIDRTNQILYKKIQTAKPSGLSIRKGLSLGRNTKLTA